MPVVKTVFEVEGKHYTIEDAGQATVKAALNKWPRKIVKILGFMINDEFIQADLN